VPERALGVDLRGAQINAVLRLKSERTPTLDHAAHFPAAAHVQVVAGAPVDALAAALLHRLEVHIATGADLGQAAAGIAHLRSREGEVAPSAGQDHARFAADVDAGHAVDAASGEAVGTVWVVAACGAAAETVVTEESIRP